MSILETYLSRLTSLRNVAVPETSHYAILQTLLNEVASDLKPRIDAVIHPKNTGAGIPDLGLFDENQPKDQLPAHGIVEAKPISDDLTKIANSKQVARYVSHYGQALVTNFYQFVLVTRNPHTQEPVIEERYDLASTSNEFWDLNQAPHTLAAKHEIPLTEYLKRVLRRNAPLITAKEVAWLLASYAREAKARLESNDNNLDTLTQIRTQLELALGIQFKDENAEDFFRSTLVQTLFYGLFSAWVLWHEKNPPTSNATFDLWRDTRRLNIPVISELFNLFSGSTTLPLSVEQILNWTTDALNRIDRKAFFHEMGYDTTDLAELGSNNNAIQYFYEPFLEAFDPNLRRQLGVWYTPREIVRYMVARVDNALKHDLNIPDGLADPNVYILDPCCGTGAYLVEVLRHISTTLISRDGSALAGQNIKTAIQERIFGFELLPAPFVIAHLQIAILLSHLNAPLHDGQRAGIYLTNALTGWETGKVPQKVPFFPELAKERDTANQVKQSSKILVILGNPPYSGFAGIAEDPEERALSNAYRTPKNPHLLPPQGQGLNDLYIRFYRMAERQITENAKCGIVCFITNASWLDGLSHPAMREQYLDVFDDIIIDNLNGSKFKTSPTGETDQSIFSTETSDGISISTSIATLVRIPEHTGTKTLRFRDLWGTDKRTQLKTDTSNLHSITYQEILPELKLGLPFLPRTITIDYGSWPKLPQLFPVSFPGVKTSRDDVLVDIDRDRLDKRMQQYFDPKISHEELRRIAPGFMNNSSRYNAESIRDTLRKRGYLSQNIVKYAYRPFDVRYLYWEPQEKLLDEKRSDYFPHVQKGNIFLFTTGRTRKNIIEAPICTDLLNDLNLMDSGARGFPLYLSQKTQMSFSEVEQASTAKPEANLSETAKDYLDSLGLPYKDSADILFYHSLAIPHSPLYRMENTGGLHQDWPRIPLPNTRGLLEASANLGRQVAALLDVETPVQGITRGSPRPDIQTIAVLTTLGNLPPDFTLTAKWGYLKETAVMPSRGRIVQHDDLIDVYLNESTYWRDIPIDVWEYTLGGYPVLKKWLSYREASILGRPLKPEEATEFRNIARRIAALLALNPLLDENYISVKENSIHRDA